MIRARPWQVPGPCRTGRDPSCWQSSSAPASRALLSAPQVEDQILVKRGRAQVMQDSQNLGAMVSAVVHQMGQHLPERARRSSSVSFSDATYALTSSAVASHTSRACSRVA
jgi:hypothetical protein